MIIVLPMNNSKYPNVFPKFKKPFVIVINAKKLTMLITITSFFIYCFIIQFNVKVVFILVGNLINSANFLLQ